MNQAQRKFKKVIKRRKKAKIHKKAKYHDLLWNMLSVAQQKEFSRMHKNYKLQVASARRNKKLLREAKKNNKE